MKKKKILFFLLCQVIMVALVLPANMLAEDAIAYDDDAELIILDDDNVVELDDVDKYVEEVEYVLNEPPVEAEPETEEAAPAAETPIEEEPSTLPQFEGYMKLKDGTEIFADKALSQILATADGDGVVYGLATDNNDVFEIGFDIEETREAANCFVGFISADDFAWVEDEGAFVAGLPVSELRTVGDGIYITRIDVVLAASDATEEPAEEPVEELTEGPAEEPVEGSAEEPVEGSAEEPAEEPAEELTDEPAGELPGPQTLNGEGDSGSEEDETSVQTRGVLGAPQNLTAIALTDTSAKLTWDAVDGADQYRILRSIDGGSFSILKTVTGTETTTYNLTAGVVYAFKVAAVQGDTVGTESEAVSLTIVVPAAPENLRAEQLSTTSIKLDWDAVDGATGYRLYRSINEGSFTLVKTVYTNNTSNYNINLSSNTYRYKVAAVIENGESAIRGDYSNDAYLDRQIPVPTNVRALRVSDTKVALSWNAVQGATGYRLYRSVDNDDTYTLVKTVITTTTENGVDLTAHEYSYKVIALLEEGNVIYKSNYSAATPVEIPEELAAPENLVVEKLTTSSIKMSWDGVDGATGYRIYRATNEDEYALVKTVTTTNTASYGLDFNNVYRFRVAAIRGDGATAVKSEYSNEVLLSGILEAPSNVRVAKSGSSSVTISWDPVDGATGYRLYRSINGGDYALVKTVMETSTQNYSLDFSNLYIYRVIALQETTDVIQKSDYSLEVAVGYELLAPTNVRAVKENNSTARISWEAVENATGYRLYRSINDGPYSLVKTVAETETMNYSLDLENNQYAYKIMAVCVLDDYNITLKSEYSEAAIVTEESGDENEFVVDDIVYVIIENGVEVFGYNGNASHLTIPQTVNDYTVISIGESAFENNSTLVSIDLPDTIVVIKRRAFANCSSLSTMY